MNRAQITLTLLEETLMVCRLGPEDPIPDWALQSLFYSVSRTRDELSIVCEQSSIPDGIRAEPDWRGLRIVGKLDFNLTGILASIAEPLAENGIAIFAISTFDTDYVLVKQASVQRAIDVLVAAGHQFAKM